MSQLENDILALCQSTTAPVVIDVPIEWFENLETHLRSLVEGGYFVQRIDDRVITNEQELFDSISRTCRFPEPFGRNWASLRDALCDFSWISPKPQGFVLAYGNPDQLSWSALSEFVVTVDRARGACAPYGEPFKVLFPAR